MSNRWQWICDQKIKARRGSESDGSCIFREVVRKGLYVKENWRKYRRKSPRKAEGTIRAKALNFHLMLRPSIFRPALQIYILCPPFEDEKKWGSARGRTFSKIQLVPDRARVKPSSSDFRDGAVNSGGCLCAWKWGNYCCHDAGSQSREEPESRTLGFSSYTSCSPFCLPCGPQPPLSAHLGLVVGFWNHCLGLSMFIFQCLSPLGTSLPEAG